MSRAKIWLGSEWENWESRIKQATTNVPSAFSDFPELSNFENNKETNEILCSQMKDIL